MHSLEAIAIETGSHVDRNLLAERWRIDGGRRCLPYPAFPSIWASEGNFPNEVFVWESASTAFLEAAKARHG